MKSTWSLIEGLSIADHLEVILPSYLINKIWLVDGGEAAVAGRRELTRRA